MNRRFLSKIVQRAYPRDDGRKRCGDLRIGCVCEVCLPVYKIGMNRRVKGLLHLAGGAAKLNGRPALSHAIDPKTVRRKPRRELLKIRLLKRQIARRTARAKARHESQATICPAAAREVSADADSAVPSRVKTSSIRSMGRSEAASPRSFAGFASGDDCPLKPRGKTRPSRRCGLPRMVWFARATRPTG